MSGLVAMGSMTLMICPRILITITTPRHDLHPGCHPARMPLHRPRGQYLQAHGAFGLAVGASALMEPACFPGEVGAMEQASTVSDLVLDGLRNLRPPLCNIKLYRTGYSPPSALFLVFLSLIAF